MAETTRPLGLGTFCVCVHGGPESGTTDEGCRRKVRWCSLDAEAKPLCECNRCERATADVTQAMPEPALLGPGPLPERASYCVQRVDGECQLRREAVTDADCLVCRYVRTPEADSAPVRGIVPRRISRDRIGFFNFTPTLTQVCNALTARRTSRRPLVVEYGPGQSTATILERLPGAEIISIEHDPEWTTKWRTEYATAIEAGRLTILERPLAGGSCPEYVRAPRELLHGRPVDLSFIDGRKRALCLDEAREWLDPSGCIILHDSERTRYGAALRRWRWLSTGRQTALAAASVQALDFWKADIGWDWRNHRRITLVLNTHNEPDLGGTVDATVEYITRDGYEADVVVVDDAGDAFPVPKRDGWRVVRNPTRIGCGRCKNIGLDHAMGAYVLHMDAHTRLTTNRMRTWVEAADLTRSLLVPCVTTLHYNESDLAPGRRQYHSGLGQKVEGWPPQVIWGGRRTTHLQELPNPSPSIYFARRDVWVHQLGGWYNFIGQWGQQEFGVGVRTWFTGTPGRSLPTVLGQHRFQSSFRYKVSATQPATNLAQLYRVTLDPDTYESVIAPRMPLVPGGRTALKMMDEYADEIERERVQFARVKRRRDADWLAAFDHFKGSRGATP